MLEGFIIRDYIGNLSFAKADSDYIDSPLTSECSAARMGLILTCSLGITWIILEGDSGFCFFS